MWPIFTDVSIFQVLGKSKKVKASTKRMQKSAGGGEIEREERERRERWRKGLTFTNSTKFLWQLKFIGFLYPLPTLFRQFAPTSNDAIRAFESGDTLCRCRSALPPSVLRGIPKTSLRFLFVECFFLFSSRNSSRSSGGSLIALGA